MGKHVRSVGVLAAAGTLLVCVGACAGPAASTATTPSATASAAPATTTAAAATTTPAAAARPLAEVFPDVADPTCAPADSSVRTGTGAVPSEAYTCDYSAVAAGATVIFAQWPDQAGAQAWYQDTENLGERVETNDQWQVGGVTQGALYTAQNANQVVISTGVYENLPYTWEIRTATLDESNTIFGQIQLRPATEIG
jgi:hypothetical protein